MPQGDPIFPYLFLFRAEIIAILIKTNSQIVGITIDDKEFKLTQFADDTTIILDGIQDSLFAAVNTLEMFSNFSALKMKKKQNNLDR